MFMDSTITHLPLIDCSKTPNGGSLGYLFYGARRLISVEKWLLPTTPCVFGENDTFQSCNSLTDITIEGVLWCSLSLSPCPLSRSSIENFVSVLSDEASGKTITFNKAAVDKAFETSEGAADGSTTAEWEALIATKSNWTIALA